MMGSFVGAADYDGIDGFGTASAQEVADLQKALRSGQDRNAPSTVVAGDGFTLKPESLDRTLKVVTFKMEHIDFWKFLDKVPAYNTVEEYSRLREYGNAAAFFIEEGELPSESDATYSREFNIIKYMGVTKRVTHVMQTVRTHIGSAVAQETVNGTMDLLRAVESALFYADSDKVPQEFDGLFPQLEAQASAANIIDMRGKPLNQDVIEEAAHIIRAAPNYGVPTDLFMADGVYSDLARLFYPTQRSNLPTPAGDGMIGFRVDGMRTQAGTIRFHPNVFITPGQIPVTAGVGEVGKRPGPPTLGAPSAGADAASQFAATDAGDYIYKVCAKNRYGVSTPVTASTVTVAAGDKVTISITDGSPLATCYVVYRTAKNGAAATATQITVIKRTGAATSYVDKNENLPTCTKAALIQGNRENLVVKQLAPFTRIPLATVDTSMRWAQILYLALTLHSPNKNVLFKNVGRIDGTKQTSI